MHTLYAYQNATRHVVRILLRGGHKVKNFPEPVDTPMTISLELIGVFHPFLYKQVVAKFFVQPLADTRKY